MTGPQQQIAIWVLKKTSLYLLIEHYNHRNAPPPPPDITYFLKLTKMNTCHDVFPLVRVGEGGNKKGIQKLGAS